MNFTNFLLFLNYSASSSSSLFTTSSKPFDGFFQDGFSVLLEVFFVGLFFAAAFGSASFILNPIFLFFVSNNINLAFTISQSFTTSFGFCTDF